MNKPMVSVWCTTYNHEKYIRDAIEGFLMQKTDFEFEIVIHDDASTDGTITVLREYEKKYPKLIRVIYETENQYSKYRYPSLFFYPLIRRESRGKYIAMCEGDDYWTDANKLQIQIDYMESNFDCVMTGHDVVCLNCQTGEKKRLMLCQENKDITVNGFIKDEEDITTASFVFRREMLYMEDFFLEVSVGDYPLKLYCLTKGKVHYFAKPMSVYRYLREGAWSSNQIRDFQSYITRWVDIFVLLEKFNKYTDNNYTKVIVDIINNRFNKLIIEFSKLSKQQFLCMSENCIRNSRIESHKYFRQLIKLFRQYYDVEYLDEELREFSKTYKNILIWGTGKYGELISKQLINNNIKYEGFIDSDKWYSDRMYLGKKVWKFIELPFLFTETGIIVAVGLKYKEEIFSLIESSKFDSFIYPFDVNCDNLIY